MNLLVLGNSDTEGLESGGKTWTTVVRDGVQAAVSEPVTFAETRFYPGTPTAASYAEQKARDFAADVVVMPLGGFAFSVGFVWKRVERLFGKRAGAWYRRIEESFDDKTKGSTPGARSSLNRASRKVVRTVVGTEPLTTAKQLAEDYTTTLRALARVERAHVVVVAYPGRAPKTQPPKIARQLREFHASVHAAADEHRFLFVESRQAFESVPKDISTNTPDGYHLNQAGHQLLGDTVLAAMRTARVVEGAAT